MTGRGPLNHVTSYVYGAGSTFSDTMSEGRGGAGVGDVGGLLPSPKELGS